MFLQSGNAQSDFYQETIDIFGSNVSYFSVFDRSPDSVDNVVLVVITFGRYAGRDFDGCDFCNWSGWEVKSVSSKIYILYKLLLNEHDFLKNL